MNGEISKIVSEDKIDEDATPNECKDIESDEDNNTKNMKGKNNNDV